MPDEKIGDAGDESLDAEAAHAAGEAGDPTPGRPEKDAADESGGASGATKQRRKPGAATLPGIRHVTPLTVGMTFLSVLCAVALIVIFNLESVRNFLEGEGLLWILPAALVVIFGFLVAFVIGREVANLHYVEGVLDSMVDSNKRLRLLMEAGREIGSTLDLPEILRMVLDYASEVTGAGIGAVYLWEKSEDTLKLALIRGVDEHKMMFKALPMKKGLLGEVAADRQIVAIDDMSSIDERDNVFFGAAEPRSIAMVPLVARGRFLGMLVAANAEAHEYSLDEKRLLDGLAELASLSITNAELYRIARKSLDALSRERGVTGSVLEEMVAGVVTADARGRIGVFNREAQRLTGYTF
ncbi:MAG: GAF domain-containing protein, partial [Candidatus Geothermincolia bacterium]